MRTSTYDPIYASICTDEEADTMNHPVIIGTGKLFDDESIWVDWSESSETFKNLNELKNKYVFDDQSDSYLELVWND